MLLYLLFEIVIVVFGPPLAFHSCECIYFLFIFVLAYFEDRVFELLHAEICIGSLSGVFLKLHKGGFKLVHASGKLHNHLPILLHIVLLIKQDLLVDGKNLHPFRCGTLCLSILVISFARLVSLGFLSC